MRVFPSFGKELSFKSLAFVISPWMTKRNQTADRRTMSYSFSMILPTVDAPRHLSVTDLHFWVPGNPLSTLSISSGRCCYLVARIVPDSLATPWSSSCDLWSLPGSSLRISQARILEWTAISLLQDLLTQRLNPVSCSEQIIYHWAIREACVIR